MNEEFDLRYEMVDEMPLGGGVSGIGWRVRKRGQWDGKYYCAKIYRV